MGRGGFQRLEATVRQQEDTNTVSRGSVQRVLGPQRRGSLHSSCRDRKGTVAAGDITAFH